MTDLTDEQIEALCEAATTGPWHSAGREIVTRWSNTWQPIATTRSDGLAGPRSIANAALAAAARTLVPSLLERARKAEAKRDALRDGNQAIVETCERIALERDEWKCEALGKRAALDVLSAERDALAAKLRAVEALARTPETDWLWEPGDRGPGFYYFRTIQPRELRAALSADTTPEATR